MAKTASEVQNLEQARRAEEHLLSEMAEHGYDEAATFAVRLAVEEGLNNALRYGARCSPERPVRITCEVDDACVRVRIADGGEGFNPGLVPDPTLDENLEKPTGRGIMLMRAYMDEVLFNEKGNEVCMIKRKQ